MKKQKKIVFLRKSSVFSSLKGEFLRKQKLIVILFHRNERHRFLMFFVVQRRTKTIHAVKQKAYRKSRAQNQRWIKFLHLISKRLMKKKDQIDNFRVKKNLSFRVDFRVEKSNQFFYLENEPNLPWLSEKQFWQCKRFSRTRTSVPSNDDDKGILQTEQRKHSIWKYKPNDSMTIAEPCPWKQIHFVQEFLVKSSFLYPIHRRNANTEVYRWPKELDCYYCWLLFELVFSCKRKGKKSNFNEKLTQKRTFALSMFDCDCFLVKFLVDFHDFDFVAEKVRLVHRNET